MAITPTRIKLEAGDDTLAINWADGHSSVYGYKFLREKCPCATCKGAERKPSKVKIGAGALPMFKPLARPLRAEIVGRYALQIFWSDGHSAGIYTFPYLREICPCDSCGLIREREEGQPKSG